MRDNNYQLNLTKGPSHILSAVNYKSLLIWGQGYLARFQLKFPRQYYFTLPTILILIFTDTASQQFLILVISFHDHVKHHTCKGQKCNSLKQHFVASSLITTTSGFVSKPIFIYL